jgi:hypothetical protein
MEENELRSSMSFYTMACFASHWSSFSVLLLGRICSGVATSLLHSTFEIWVVREHHKHGFKPDLLMNIFSQAAFFGNGVVAILSGIIAHILVEILDLGPRAPFDAAATILLSGGLFIFLTWSENVSTGSTQGSLVERVSLALKLLAEKPVIALLGTTQALFEATIYIFVFLWTPALTPNGEQIPNGLIFTSFMLSAMVGSSLGDVLLSSRSTRRLELSLPVVFALSAACLSVPALLIYVPSRLNSIKDLFGKLQILCFCGFETTVGITWPCLMALRAKYVPDGVQSMMITLFRIPLNILVCMVFSNASFFSAPSLFGICSFFLILCALCIRQLVKYSDDKTATKIHC